MRRGFGQAVPDVPFPEGVSLLRVPHTRIDRDFISRWAAIKDDAFADHFNSAPTNPDVLMPFRDLAEEKMEFVIATGPDGKPVGVSLHSVEASPGERQGWVNVIGVVPAARRRGLGRALLANSVRWLRENGAGEAFLGVDSQNERALPLYRSVGFDVAAESQAWELKL